MNVTVIKKDETIVRRYNFSSSGYESFADAEVKIVYWKDYEYNNSMKQKVDKEAVENRKKEISKKYVKEMNPEWIKIKRF